jgi:pyruvate/2-oxoglutarate dehydrogenase complex dihydrolipoamide dehydrogenase (E3) component
VESLRRKTKVEVRDVVIIGGGPAGYRAAIRVSQLGGKGTLIDNDSLGGTCIILRTLTEKEDCIERLVQ